MAGKVSTLLQIVRLSRLKARNDHASGILDFGSEPVYCHVAPERRQRGEWTHLETSADP